MPGCAPNDEFPGPRFPAGAGGETATLAGAVPVAGVTAPAVARAVEALERPDVDVWRAASCRWADRRTWGALLPVWVEAFVAAAANGPAQPRPRTVDRRGRRR